VTRLDGLDLKQIEREVRAICKSVGCRACDVEDVIQNTFLALLQEDITVNTACGRALRLRNQPQSGPNPDTLPAPGPGPDEIVQDQEDHRLLMAQFTPVEQEILALLRDGYTHYEIAQRLGFARRTVSMKVARLRERMKRTKEGM